jgi:hypothetical protein
MLFFHKIGSVNRFIWAKNKLEIGQRNNFTITILLSQNFLISPTAPSNLPINLMCPAGIHNLFEMAQETTIDLPGHWEQIQQILK